MTLSIVTGERMARFYLAWNLWAICWLSCICFGILAIYPFVLRWANPPVSQPLFQGTCLILSTAFFALARLANRGLKTALKAFKKS